MIFIRNLSTLKPSELYDVKIDRKSPLGNPFIMYRESMRDEVCDKYESYFYTNLERLKPELERLKRLHECYGFLNLFCHCAPSRCHGETIRRYLEK